MKTGSLLDQHIEAACLRIPPLWPLRNFVAVNPYLGFTSMTFDDGLHAAGRTFGARPYMPLDYYRSAAAQGRILSTDLDAARKRIAHRASAVDAGPEGVEVGLHAGGRRSEWEAEERLERGTLAESHDRRGDARLAPRIVDHLAAWCATRFDAGQAAWKPPGSDRPLFAAWRMHAAQDRSLEDALPGLRRYVEALPEDPRAALALILDELEVPQDNRADYLARLLGSILGWAGHARHRQWEARLRGGDDDTLVHLLAARAAYEGALFRADPTLAEAGPPAEGRSASAGDVIPEEPEVLAEWQRALEIGYQRDLFARLASARSQPVACPALQAVFCIDVRSEGLRRQLEAQSHSIQTLGFAGFFGVALEHRHEGESQGSARCPALLAPPHAVEARPDPASLPDGARMRHRIGHLIEPLRKLAVSAFPFVETLGGAFAARMVLDGGGWTRPHAEGALIGSSAQPEAELVLDLPLEGRVDVAEGMLRGMHLVRGFAPVVLLCGHGSRSANNPYASSLDCGACGGHSGEVNARVAAALLNAKDVRAGLAERGIRIPEETRFVAGLHETTTDRVRLLDAADLAPERRQRIERWLERAGHAVLAERAERLGMASGAGGHVEAAERRAADWSEVRPEWGLAGNAAFVAAPRDWTRGLDLQGRTFLHEYDAALDPDGALLGGILTAPLIVASWINLQYYASTVDNERLGSGDKTLHNVVARLGVACGNDADLRTGLPWQSVHDGERFVHEPLRLTAVVAASPGAIDRVIESSESLRALVENEWIDLFAWSPESATFLRRGPWRGDWIASEAA